jgi:hypothetical protein
LDQKDLELEKEIKKRKHNVGGSKSGKEDIRKKGQGMKGKENDRINDEKSMLSDSQRLEIIEKELEELKKAQRKKENKKWKEKEKRFEKQMKETQEGKRGEGEREEKEKEKKEGEKKSKEEKKIKEEEEKKDEERQKKQRREEERRNEREKEKERRKEKEDEKKREEDEKRGKEDIKRNEEKEKSRKEKELKMVKEEKRRRKEKEEERKRWREAEKKRWDEKKEKEKTRRLFRNDDDNINKKIIYGERERKEKPYERERNEESTSDDGDGYSTSDDGDGCSTSNDGDGYSTSDDDEDSLYGLSDSEEKEGSEREGEGKLGKKGEFRIEEKVRREKKEEDYEKEREERGKKWKDDENDDICKNERKERLREKGIYKKSEDSFNKQGGLGDKKKRLLSFDTPTHLIITTPNKTFVGDEQGRSQQVTFVASDISSTQKMYDIPNYYTSQPPAPPPSQPAEPPLPPPPPPPPPPLPSSTKYTGVYPNGGVSPSYATSFSPITHSYPTPPRIVSSTILPRTSNFNHGTSDGIDLLEPITSSSSPYSQRPPVFSFSPFSPSQHTALLSTARSPPSSLHVTLSPSSRSPTTILTTSSNYLNQLTSDIDIEMYGVSSSHNILSPNKLSNNINTVSRTPHRTSSQIGDNSHIIHGQPVEILANKSAVSGVKNKLHDSFNQSFSRRGDIISDTGNKSWSKGSDWDYSKRKYRRRHRKPGKGDENVDCYSSSSSSEEYILTSDDDR